MNYHDRMLPYGIVTCRVKPRVVEPTHLTSSSTVWNKVGMCHWEYWWDERNPGTSETAMYFGHVSDHRATASNPMTNRMARGDSAHQIGLVHDPHCLADSRERMYGGDYTWRLISDSENWGGLWLLRNNPYPDRKENFTMRFGTSNRYSLQCPRLVDYSVSRSNRGNRPGAQSQIPKIEGICTCSTGSTGQIANWMVRGDPMQ